MNESFDRYQRQRETWELDRRRRTALATLAELRTGPRPRPEPQPRTPQPVDVDDAAAIASYNRASLAAQTRRQKLDAAYEAMRLDAEQLDKQDAWEANHSPLPGKKWGPFKMCDPPCKGCAHLAPQPENAGRR